MLAKRNRSHVKIDHFSKISTLILNSGLHPLNYIGDDSVYLLQCKSHGIDFFFDIAPGHDCYHRESPTRQSSTLIHQGFFSQGQTGVGPIDNNKHPSSYRTFVQQYYLGNKQEKPALWIPYLFDTTSTPLNHVLTSYDLLPVHRRPRDFFPDNTT